MTDYGDRLTMAPPPTRGWTFAAASTGVKDGSPAHAGMDPPAQARSGA